MANYEQEMEILNGGSGAKESDARSAESRTEAGDGKAHKQRLQALQETEAPDDVFRAQDTQTSLASLPPQLTTGEVEVKDTRMHNRDDRERSRIETDEGRAHHVRLTAQYSDPGGDSIRRSQYELGQEKAVLNRDDPELRTETDEGRAHKARQTVRYSDPRDSIRSLITHGHGQEKAVSTLPTIPSVSSQASDPGPDINTAAPGTGAGGPTEYDAETEQGISMANTQPQVATGKPHISLHQVQS